MLSCLFIPTAAHATYYSASGYISWYNGEGKIGYDEKKLTSSDCATDQERDNPPAGTKIYVNDDTTGKSKEFYKYDVCNCPEDVVLDLTKTGWKSFGHSLDEGYLRGRYFHG